MSIIKRGSNLVCKVKDSPPVNRHKPSVDVLFDSAAEICRSAAVGILLTGMGGGWRERFIKDAYGWWPIPSPKMRKLRWSTACQKLQRNLVQLKRFCRLTR